MGIVNGLLSLPVSIILVWWLVKIKKEPRFEVKDIVRMLIFGALSCVLASALSLVIMIWSALNLIGLDTIKEMVAHPENAQAIVDQIKANSDTGFSLARVIRNSMLLIALPEEGFRFLCLQLAVRKRACVRSWMDMVLCGGIVGTGFTIVEDWMYSSGGLGVTIMRSLMPFHFMLGAIMGYFIGKSRHTGKILYLIPSIVVPVLLHAVYDGAINALTSHDEYVYLALAMMAVMLAVTVLMIVLINKWRKNGKLDLEMQ